MNKRSRLVAVITCLSLTIASHNARFAYATPNHDADKTIVVAASEKSDSDFEAVLSCKGKTADTALQAAKDSGVSASFEDSYGVDVTSAVEDASNGSEVHKATVVEVKTHDLGFLGNYVTFVLDYTEPEELAKREKKAEDEANHARAIEEVKACKGMTADEALALAQKADCTAMFKDSADVDVTDSVKDPSTSSEVHNAPVTNVELTSLWILGDVAEFTLDYTDPVAKAEREAKAAKEEAIKQAVGELESSVGKTAKEVDALAKEADYTASFFDSFGVDVTEMVVHSKKDSEIANAVVMSAETREPGLFSRGSVNATLDYIEPNAARRRAEEELLEKNRDAIQGTIGKTTDEAIEVVDNIGLDLVVLDNYGTDITKDARDKKSDKKLHKAKVTNIEIGDSDRDGHIVVAATIDYLSSASIKKQAMESGYPAEITFSDISIEVSDNNPASYDPVFIVKVTGNITSNDTWPVSKDTLPTLSYTSDGYQHDSNIELAEGAEKLFAGRTLGFTYTARASGDDTEILLKTKNKDLVMHNSDQLESEIAKHLQSAQQTHDANVDAIIEEQRAAFEEQRRNRACYYTESGHCYHSKPGCPALSRSNDIYETTVGEAESWGLEPCDRCH